ncbi:HflC protein [Candidatus Gracilibacteria bacterium CG17_big_fil_post_rev_8_21_14_2_50_48_13]|nr:MAG: HflC protein [Candidatus Gracilibacteria bacterium CG17_big_fil_post_rev_8_21_14_2_50_48_13]
MKNTLLSFGAVVLVLVLSLIFSSFEIINPGERGIRVTLGQISDEVLVEGLYLKIPLVQSIVRFDVKTQKAEYESNSASKDLQSVRSIVALNYNPEPSSVGKLYADIGANYEFKIIKPALEEAIKSATAQFTAEELITKRSQVKDMITKVVTERLAKSFIDVDEISIVDFSFSPEFDKAIELKQTAEQDALRAKWDLERVKIQAQQKIETAKAEAESLRLQKQELTPELVKLRAIEKWNGVLPQVTGGATPLVSLD